MGAGPGGPVEFGGHYRITLRAGIDPFGHDRARPVGRRHLQDQLGRFGHPEAQVAGGHPPVAEPGSRSAGGERVDLVHPGPSHARGGCPAEPRAGPTACLWSGHALP